MTTTYTGTGIRRGVLQQLRRARGGALNYSTQGSCRQRKILLQGTQEETICRKRQVMSIKDDMEKTTKKPLKAWKQAFSGILYFGDPGGIRTPDPRLRRPLLYPTELLDHIKLERAMGIEPTTSAWKAEVLPLNYTRKKWSEWQDSNLRHPAPKAGALPNCATPRIRTILYYSARQKSSKIYNCR